MIQLRPVICEEDWNFKSVLKWSDFISKTSYNSEMLMNIIGLGVIGALLFCCTKKLYIMCIVIQK